MTVRFLTYNVHGCVGRKGKYDPSATLSVIKHCEADVIALQEVHQSDDKLVSGLRDQFSDHQLFEGPTLEKPTGSYGNLLLSRLPVVAHRRIDLSLPRHEPRGAIRLLCRAGPKQYLEITATHLGLLSRERLKQLRLLLDPDCEISEKANARVLIGDLNDWFPGSRFSRVLRKTFTGPAKRTFPASFPAFKLDRIQASGNATVERIEIPDAPGGATASDHLPLVGEVRLRS